MIQQPGRIFNDFIEIRRRFGARRVRICALPFCYQFTQCRSPACFYLDPATPTLPSSAPLKTPSCSGSLDPLILWFSDSLWKRKLLIRRNEDVLATSKFSFNAFMHIGWLDGWTYLYAYGALHVYWMDGWMDGWTYLYAYWLDGWMDIPLFIWINPAAPWSLLPAYEDPVSDSSKSCFKVLCYMVILYGNHALTSSCMITCLVFPAPWCLLLRTHPINVVKSHMASLVW